MILQVELVDTNGNVIWERSKISSSATKIEHQNIDVWLDNPLLFRKAFSQMIRAVAVRTLNRLSRAAEET